MAEHDAQMLKGVLGLLVLRLLAAQEDYGYALVVRLRELGVDGLPEGTVYPALVRLETQGLLTSRLVPSTSGPARKYYRPTPAGLAEADRAGRAFDALAAVVARTPGPAAPSASATSAAPDTAPDPAPVPARERTPS